MKAKNYNVIFYVDHYILLYQLDYIILTLSAIEVFYKKGALTNFAEKHVYWSFFFNKIVGSLQIY